MHGHTGHVRFLSAVEVPTQTSNKSDKFREVLSRRSSALNTVTLTSKMLVISGGDGFENYQSNVANENLGRDDSTNHLLLWQV